MMPHPCSDAVARPYFVGFSLRNGYSLAIKHDPVLITIVVMIVEGRIFWIIHRIAFILTPIGSANGEDSGPASFFAPMPTHTHQC